MIINSTKKNRTSNYLDGTETLAMVIVERTMSGTETLTPFTIKVENLSIIKDILLQVRGADGDIIGSLPRYTISGNTINIEDIAPDFVNAADNIFTIIVFGK